MAFASAFAPACLNVFVPSATTSDFCSEAAAYYILFWDVPGYISLFPQASHRSHDVCERATNGLSPAGCFEDSVAQVPSSSTPRSRPAAPLGSVRLLPGRLVFARAASG